jgi:putative endonuclease
MFVTSPSGGYALFLSAWGAYNQRVSDYYCYILHCADDSLYTGYTSDVSRRLQEHQSGRGSRYTRSRRPVELVYWEKQPTRSSAMRRERAIKSMARKAKLALIRSRPRTVNQTPENEEENDSTQ